MWVAPLVLSLEVRGMKGRTRVGKMLMMAVETNACVHAVDASCTGKAPAPSALVDEKK